MGTAEKGYRSQNVKMGPNAIEPLKMSLGAPNVITEPDALGTAKNEPGSAKYENGSGRDRYRRKRVREGKT